QVQGTVSRNTRTDFDVPGSEVPSEFRHVQTLEGDTLRVTTGTTAGPTSDVTEESHFDQLSAQASMRALHCFANLHPLWASGHAVSADELALAYTRKQVQENVISAYYNLLRAKLLLKVAEESEAVAKEQLDRTQALYDRGSAAKSDVLKSQVQHGQTRLNLVRARNNERQSHVDLEHAMNLILGADFDIDTTVSIRNDAVPTYEAERDFAKD